MVRMGALIQMTPPSHYAKEKEKEMVLLLARMGAFIQMTPPPFPLRKRERKRNKNIYYIGSHAWEAYEMTLPPYPIIYRKRKKKK